ncbi:MAG: hypothetical protein CM1200mP24_02870 [Gammaproteobacteria bacterium]|nr:MAG: hypothetical protein CM1200mP24_02870 [Gammaproteobacteria bacterium]
MNDQLLEAPIECPLTRVNEDLGRLQRPYEYGLLLIGFRPGSRLYL